MNLSYLRREYTASTLREDMLPSSPFQLFSSWLKEALELEQNETTAMVLSTVNAEGNPSSRIVLLKDFGEEGFTFFTNYQSRKGHEIEQRPMVALLFFWPRLERQVRIEGKAEKLPSGESDTYFCSRPEGNRISAWASPQSQEVPDRQYLEKRFLEMKNTYFGKDIPRPDYWGGYRVLPYRMEFWQGRENRLHDRIAYSLENGIWNISRLAP